MNIGIPELIILLLAIGAAVLIALLVRFLSRR